MSASKPAQGLADCVSLWLAAALVDPSGCAYGEARSAVFEAVRADRAGEVARRLLDLAGSERPRVRHLVLRLLTDLCLGDQLWDAAAQVATGRLGDADEGARRAAAWLLAAAGGTSAVQIALADSLGAEDPVVRVALAEAMCAELRAEPDPADLASRLDALCRDGDPAVRVVARLALLRRASAAEQRLLEAAVMADLPVAGSRLGEPGGLVAWRVGEHWGLALVRQGREDDSYALAKELLDPAQPAVVRRAGLDVAWWALREWRSAPAQLADVLTRVVVDGPDELRTAAVEVVGASLDASRRCVEPLAALVDDLESGAEATLALARVGDGRAVPGLARLVWDGRIQRGFVEAANGVANTDADLGPFVAACRAFLRQHRDPCQRKDVRNRCPLPLVCHGLASLGTHAAPAVPELVSALAAALEASADVWTMSSLVRALSRIGPTAQVAVPLLERIAGEETSNGEQVRHALVGITEDRSRAEAYLDALPTGGRGRYAEEPALLRFLADHGGLDARQVARLWDRPSRYEAYHVLKMADLLWRHAGSGAAEELLAVLPGNLDDDVYGPPALAVLADMGSLARPALPTIEAMIDRRIRIRVHLGDFDEEMRADERLLMAAIAARDAVRAALTAKGG